MNRYPEANAHFSCKVNQKLLLQITRLRDALVEIQKSMQEKHLACCIFPRFRGSSEIARAMQQLSLKRIGALIALEQEIGLSDYVRSGTLLNAELSASLLLSLFYPGNPLHDGAVIIRGNSVVAAGCVLPLSGDHTPFKLKDLGLRHRAGVGLSQVSDAVVFVVSEETGTISMATEGHLFEMNLEDSPEAIERLPKNTPALDDVISLD
jgi:uncharacterized protein (TIGR00159 family)